MAVSVLINPDRNPASGDAVRNLTNSKVLPLAFVLALVGCCLPQSHAADTHSAQGVVLKTDAAHHSLTVSCNAIAGYMEPMEMEFAVRDIQALSKLKPGTAIHFTIVSKDQKLYADSIHESTTANFEAEPMAAGQLQALNRMLDKPLRLLAAGEHVPDFVLTDQTGKTIHLSDCEGKVVVLTFGYSRCPNPNYCFRLSNNLAQIQKRFHEQAGQDLILLTIMIDPEHDQGTTLAQYAAVWKANPANWHFLTGPLPQIKQVAGQFGMNFWSVEGSITHSLHTVIVDREGRLAVNLDGNQFTPRQLGDLVRTVMNHP